MSETPDAPEIAALHRAADDLEARLRVVTSRMSAANVHPIYTKPENRDPVTAAHNEAIAAELKIANLQEHLDGWRGLALAWMDAAITLRDVYEISQDATDQTASRKGLFG